MPDPRILFLLDARNRVSKEVSKVRKDLTGIQKDAKSAGGGMGALTSAFGTSRLAMVGVAGVAGAVILGLKGAADAAAGEERNIARLTTSLKTNAIGFNGNIASIEKVISQRERLAFSDDDLRSSLAQLVGSFRSVDMALDRPRLAMDLARFANIDLETAGDALIKIHAGNFRALKSLGISTKDVTNENQALAKIQRIVTGQAEAYGKTATGSWEATNIAISDAVEDIGRAALPAMKDLAGVARNTLVPALELVAGATGFVGKAIGWLAEQLRGASQGSQQMAFSLAENAKAGHYSAQVALAGMVPAFTYMTNAAAQVTTTFGQMTGATGDLGRISEATAIEQNRLAHSVDSAKDATKEYLSPLEQVRKDLKDAKDAASRLTSGMGDLGDAIYGLSSTRGQLAQAKKDLAELKKAGPDSKSALDVEIWKGKIADANMKLLELGGEVAKQQGGKAYYAWIIDARQAFRDAGPDVAAYLAQLEQIGRETGLIKPLNLSAKQQAVGKGALRAGGGPVALGRPYIVGEEGPEIFVPGASGTIIPNPGRMTPSAAGAGGAPIIQFNSVWPPTRAQAREIAALVDQELYYRRAAAGR